MMIPQDILNVLSGPQGWSLIIGCLLVLLLALVYRRIGKLASNTRRDFSELREAMDILGARMDAARQVAVVPSPLVSEEEVSAADDIALESETAMIDAMQVPASVTADIDAGLRESEVAATSEPEEPVVADLADAGEAETETESVSDSFGFATPEFSGDEFETIGDDVSPEPLNGPDQGVEDDLPGVDDMQAGPDDESFGFEVPVPEDAAPVEDDGFSMADVENRFAEESQQAWDTAEDSGDFMFGGGDAATEPVADALEQEDQTEVKEAVLPGIDEQDEAEQPAGLETEPVVDSFQFGVSDATTETEEALSNGAEDLGFEAAAMDEPSPEAYPSVAADAPDVAQAAPTEAFDESSDAVQPPSVGPFEASAEVPPEPVEAAATQPSPAPAIAGLEPLPGNPDKPDVGVARCRECGRKIAYPKRLSGKRMRCPACQTAAVLP